MGEASFLDAALCKDKNNNTETNSYGKPIANQNTQDF